MKRYWVLQKANNLSMKILIKINSDSIYFIKPPRKNFCVLFANDTWIYLRLKRPNDLVVDAGCFDTLL